MKFKILISLFLSALSLQSLANDKELKVYFKCYGQFLQERLDIDNDQLAQKIKLGRITGSEACMNLLNRADLGSDGIISQDSTNLDEFGFDRKGQKILKTFNDFHRNWFESYNLNAESFVSAGTVDVFDSGDMAYYITSTLFGGKPYSYAITTDDSLEGVRKSKENGTRKRLLTGNSNLKLIRGSAKPQSAEEDQYQAWFPPLVQLGKLVGIKHRAPYSSSEDSSDENNHQADDRINLAGLGNADDEAANNMNIFRNLGAGAISTPSYLMMNLGTPQGKKTNGGLILHRRLSQSIIRDTLCRELPVIRSIDATKYVDSTGESELPFRNGLSCMKCHATMDPMARLVRGVVRDRTARNGGTGKRGFPIQLAYEIATSETEHPNEFTGWIDESDSKFSARPKNGYFLYRTVAGELVKFEERNDRGLAGITEQIVELDDYYMCASKRYLNFFTGIDIPLQDQGDFASIKFNNKDQTYFEFIQKLGQKLKKTQDLKQVIKMIIESNIYKS